MKKLILILALILTACGAPSVRLQALPTPNSNDIVLSGGTYTDYTLSKSGTASDPVVVWGNGSTLRCVLITGAYVEWTNTIVTGCPSFGIRIKGAHVRVLNNTVTDVVRSNWDGTKCSGAGSWDSAIRAADTTDVFISGNTVFRVCGEGISVLRSSYVAIENNVVYDAFSVNIYLDQTSFSTALNNWSYSTGDTRYYKAGQVARGLSIGAESYSGWAFSVHDLIIEGNTFERVRGINYIQEQAGTPSNVIVQNNNFISVAAPLVSLGTWATVTNNVSVTPTPPGIPQTATGSPQTATIAPTGTKTPPPTITSTSTPTMECYLIIRDNGERVRVCFER